MNTKTKKIIAIALAMILVCAGSVLGTLAYLTKTVAPVTNTFTAISEIIEPTEDPNPSDPEDNSGFYLYESEVELNEGAYEFTENYVVANTYDKVVPGMIIPKNPTVTANIVENVAAYVYIEVVDETTEGELTYAISTSWSDTGLTGPNGGKVYSYGTDSITGVEDIEVDEVTILEDDQVTAGSDLSGLTAEALTFYAYACQASGFTSASEAFTSCFLAD